MVSDWDGKAESFKIHSEGWALIIVAIFMVSAIGVVIFNWV